MSLLSSQSFCAGRILVVDDDQGARDHVLPEPLELGALRRPVRAMRLDERAP